MVAVASFPVSLLVMVMEGNHRVPVGAYQDDSVGLSIWCMLNLLVGNLL